MSEYKSNAQECLNRVSEELLGRDYYITSPVSGNQVNEMLTEEIINRYKHKLLMKK